ncbi:MAG TPA: DinB family protein [Chloroflexota bacterium]|nr:DinB family protein [Chloroflexota bacterium]
MTKDELVAVVEASWRHLDSSVEGLDETAMLEPGVVGDWSIKDTLGHVTACDGLVVLYLERRRRGEPQPEGDGDSVDEYNAREATRRRGWSLAHILDEAADIRGRLRTLLADLTDEEWEEQVTINGRQRRLGEWAGDELGGDDGPGTHAAEHAAEIESWRAAHERRGGS